MYWDLMHCDICIEDFIHVTQLQLFWDGTRLQQEAYPRLVVAVLLVGLLLPVAERHLDLDEYAASLVANKQNMVASDVLMGNLTPLFTGCASLSDAVPVGVYVNCHYGSKPYNITISRDPTEHLHNSI